MGTILFLVFFAAVVSIGFSLQHWLKRPRPRYAGVRYRESKHGAWLEVECAVHVFFSIGRRRPWWSLDESRHIGQAFVSSSRADVLSRFSRSDGVRSFVGELLAHEVVRSVRGSPGKLSVRLRKGRGEDWRAEVDALSTFLDSEASRFASELGAEGLRPASVLERRNHSPWMLLALAGPILLSGAYALISYPLPERLSGELLLGWTGLTAGALLLLTAAAAWQWFRSVKALAAAAAGTFAAAFLLEFTGPAAHYNASQVTDTQTVSATVIDAYSRRQKGGRRTYHVELQSEHPGLNGRWRVTPEEWSQVRAFGPQPEVRATVATGRLGAQVLLARTFEPAARR